MTLDDEFGSRLAQCRAERGFSQQEFAAATGIAPAQISRYESGKSRPRPGILAKLADKLGVSMAWLATGKSSFAINTPLLVNMPLELKERLEQAGAASKRSLNGEIIFRLEMSLALSNDSTSLSEREQQLSQEIFQKYQLALKEQLEDLTKHFEKMLKSRDQEKNQKS